MQGLRPETIKMILFDSVFPCAPQRNMGTERQRHFWLLALGYLFIKRPEFFFVFFASY